MTFARHLDGVGAILAAADRCAATLDGFVAAGLLGKGGHRHARAFAETYVSCLREARASGISGSEEARLLLRDGVNAVHTARRTLCGVCGDHRALWKASTALVTEFKPEFCRHHGFEVGDRVGMVACGHPIQGSVSYLDPFDNDRGRVRMDGCAGDLDIEFRSINHVPTYRGRLPLAA